MIPSNFGESSFENQPETFKEPEGTFVVDANSSGLVVPESYAQNKAAQLQAEQQAGQQPDASGQPDVLGESLPFEPDLVPDAAEGEKQKNVPELTPDRAKVVEKAVEELEKTGITEATSEEDAINKIAEAAAKKAADAGETPDPAKIEKEKERAKRWMDRAAAVAGMTFNEFKAANEGSNLKTFLDAFLVFGTEGRFGDTSASSLRETLGKDTDDAYLNEVLEKGGEKTLIKFFQDVLDDSNIQDLSNITELVKQFNNEVLLHSEDIKKRMAVFLNEAKGQNKDRNFSKIQELFERFDGMGEEKILKYFNIDLTKKEEANGEITPTATETTTQAAPTTNIEQQQAAA